MKRVPAYTPTGSIQPLEPFNTAAVYDPVEKCYYIAETESERVTVAATHQANLATYRTATTPNTSSGYLIGAYYYPGWKDNSDLRVESAQVNPMWNTPWLFGNGYNRTPAMGYYPEGQQYVMDNQIRQASGIGGVDFFAFCHYRKNNVTIGAHAVTAFKASSEKARMKYCLMWDVASFPIASQQHFLDAIAEMQTSHFNDPQYLTIGGRPVVMIQPLANFASKMVTIGYHATSEPLACTNALAAARAYGTAANIYFVALAQTTNHWFSAVAGGAGFDAITAYNYQRRTMDRNTGAVGPRPANYQALVDDVLVPEWQWAVTANPTALKYWPVVMHGWDSRPWAGVEIGIATPTQWDESLAKVKTILDNYPTKTAKTMMINAWNEWHEGSFIEPNSQTGCTYLRSIKTTFK